MTENERLMFEFQKTKIARLKPEELRTKLLKGISQDKIDAWRKSSWYIQPGRFEKWEACGNDFVIASEPAEGVTTWRMISRHYGVGGDGLIYIMPSEVADVKICIINNDGSEAEMCGNGIRCVGQFYFARNPDPTTQKHKLTVETKAGLRELVVDDETRQVRVNMGGVTPLWSDFCKLPGREYDASHLSIGNPHTVLVVRGTELGEVELYGPMFENDFEAFPERTNVEWLEVINRKRIRVKVWERGVGRTLACGTGACAAAAVAKDRGYVDELVFVELEGGEVDVDVSELPYGDVYLLGDANYIYSGEIPPEED